MESVKHRFQCGHVYECRAACMYKARGRSAQHGYDWTRIRLDLRTDYSTTGPPWSTFLCMSITGKCTPSSQENITGTDTHGITD